MRLANDGCTWLKTRNALKAYSEAERCKQADLEGYFMRQITLMRELLIVSLCRYMIVLFNI